MDKARLIIPFWGDKYLDKVLNFTLPALLAHENLPAFAECFDLQVVIVTELRFTELIREAPIVRQLMKLAPLHLIPIDDVLTNSPGEYGVTLTYAYWLGFRDLGPKIVDVILLFLNADFIVADSSYRNLAQRLQEGDRLILAPSFRVNSEDIRESLSKRMDSGEYRLEISARQMVELALQCKHPTVVARTINQQAFHLTHMDQYYWYIDEHTMVGYQHPVALLAARPEQEMLEPTLMWDYSFVPDLCPKATMSFLDDSDDFFMIELQEKRTGDDMVRPGWLSRDDMVKLVGSWSSEWQRACGQHMLTFHARELSPEFEHIIRESREFMADIAFRMAKFPPKSHLNHPFTPWFEMVREKFSWIHSAPPPSAAVRTKSRSAVEMPSCDQPEELLSSQNLPYVKGIFWKAAATIYDMIIGRIPNVRRTHPLWPEMGVVMRRLPPPNPSDVKDTLFLVIGSSILSRYYRSAGIRPIIFYPRGQNTCGQLCAKGQFSSCFIETEISTISDLRQIYRQVLPYLSSNGEIITYIRNHDGYGILERDIVYLYNSFPDFGITKVSWLGTAEHAKILKKLRDHARSGLLPRLMWVLRMLANARKVARINQNGLDRSLEIYDPHFTAVFVETKLGYLPENRAA